jgi:hypothetical protein
MTVIVAFWTQLTSQYQKYIDRYGCGAVVYWDGFVAELFQPALENGLLLLDSWPDGALHLDRLTPAGIMEH